MKKLLIVFVFIIVGLTSFAQTEVREVKQKPTDPPKKENIKSVPKSKQNNTQIKKAQIKQTQMKKAQIQNLKKKQVVRKARAIRKKRNL